MVLNRIRLNELSYLLMLEWYCLDGDLEKAAYVLKRVNIRVDKVLRCLVEGHIRMNNYSEAQQLLDEFSNDEIDFDQDDIGRGNRRKFDKSHIALKAVLAVLQNKLNEQDAIVKYDLDKRTKFDNSFCFLSDNQFRSIILRYSKSEMFDLCVDFIRQHGFPILPISLQCNIDAMNLIMDGRSEDAAKLVAALPHNPDFECWISFLNCYADHCVQLNVDPIRLMTVVGNETVEPYRFWASHCPLYATLKRNNVDASLRVMEWLHNQQGYRLKAHYFYPIINSNAEVDRIIRFAKQYGIDVDNDYLFSSRATLALLQQGVEKSQIENLIRFRL
ncbi:hypothetical protein ACOME3_003436 [Neoechinorhynchus agilis]